MSQSSRRRSTTQTSPGSQRRLENVSAISAISALIVVFASSCGQKGPPLPPIIRTPVAPVLNADRRGSVVEIGLTTPSANTDGSRPANIARVDIYAVNGGAAAMTDADIVKRGMKVASVAVKSPRDPNETAEADESVESVETPSGEGVDQGASSSIADRITASMLETLTPPAGRRRGLAPPTVDRPLLGPPASTELRTYIGVGIDKNGHRGQFSKRVSVPLLLPPSPPPPIDITVEEKKISVTWKPDETSDDNVLESHPFGPLQPQVAYNLYDAKTGQKLNPAPIKENGYEDTRMDWGTERCYIVRAVEIVARLPVESEGTGPACKMLVDTFAPAPPKGLNAVATQGSINLIWDANTEPDLAGYYVLRAQAPGTDFRRITPQPITDASFFDTVASGVRYRYAVEAVDKAGNVSKPSESVEETAR